MNITYEIYRAIHDAIDVKDARWRLRYLPRRDAREAAKFLKTATRPNLKAIQSVDAVALYHECLKETLTGSPANWR